MSVASQRKGTFSARRQPGGLAPSGKNLSNTATRPPGASTRSTSRKVRIGSSTTARIKCSTTRV
jgi:hypothetical protein